MIQVLLKARPIAPQLQDRLAAPVPEGLELYLDRRDLEGDDFLVRIVGAIHAAPVPDRFVWIVEAPTRTLDGVYFDLTADTPDSRETLRRVLRVGAAIGAVAANVHVVAPTDDPMELTRTERTRKLDAARPLLGFYVDRCGAAGLIPQVENIPPVGRMREAAYIFSPIGVAPSDLAALAEWFPSLRFTVDLSHAALFQNWRAGSETELDPWLRPVARFYRADAESADLAEYLARLAPRTTTVHVSNALGWFGEGLAYRDGPEHLDEVLAPFLETISYAVTETLEADDRRATGMREAQGCLARLRTHGLMPRTGVS